MLSLLFGFFIGGILRVSGLPCGGSFGKVSAGSNYFGGSCHFDVWLVCFLSFSSHEQLILRFIACAVQHQLPLDAYRQRDR